MADFTFLFNRKGAIYPLDFSTHRTQTSQRLTSTTTTTTTTLNNEWPFNNLLDSTLVHLCCKVLVNLPAREFDRMTDNIPIELYVPLFKATLYPVRDTAIDVRQISSILKTLFFCLYQVLNNYSKQNFL